MTDSSPAPVLQPTSPSKPAFPAIIDWIDRELGEAYGHQCGKGGNTLLELRRIFSEPRINRLLPRVLRLLPKVEKHHYLLSFRIRTLLASQFHARVSDPLERSASQFFALPRCTNELRRLRTTYFEMSEVLVPENDIRIEFVAGPFAA